MTSFLLLILGALKSYSSGGSLRSSFLCGLKPCAATEYALPGDSVCRPRPQCEAQDFYQVISNVSAGALVSQLMLNISRLCDRRYLRHAWPVSGTTCGCLPSLVSVLEFHQVSRTGTVSMQNFL